MTFKVPFHPKAFYDSMIYELLLQALWATPIAGFTIPVPMPQVTTHLADILEQDTYLCLSPSLLTA